MSIERREFLKYIGAGAIATTVRPPIGSGDEPSFEHEQKIHQDYQSNNPGLEYYFLGNGQILVALQSSMRPEEGTHCGVLLMSSEHFSRKMSTYLYHPERGLQNSRVTVVINGKGFLPECGISTVGWRYPNSIPTVTIGWEAGGCAVTEELMCPVNDSALVRTVTIHNKTSAAVTASGIALLYPNLMFFDEYHVDRKNMTLTAMGYETLQLFSLNKATVGDRHISMSFGEIPAGGVKSFTLVLTLNLPREEFLKKGLAAMIKESEHYWNKRALFSADHEGLNRLFDCSKTALRAAVAKSGKMDGGIWQYNMEWVRDQSMVAIGSTLCGHPDVAEALLRRILERSVDEEGRAVDASRHRPPETIELDQNGELIYALWTHWVWTGDDSILREYRQKVKAVANYVLRTEFFDATVGLVRNSREYWERDPAFGVKEGYENAYQAWNIIGLGAAADLARHMNESALAKKWMEASGRMKESFLHHPKFSLVDDGILIKRRLTNGEAQTTFEPPNRKAMPPGVPLNVEHVSYCDPDTASVIPVMFELVEPKGPLALKTLDSMEVLWNQRWTTGGYARYNITSEPDSPGPWPFATMFLARSYLEAGNDEKVWRALNWMLNVPTGGKGGSWLECYVDRPVPPLPPVGIVVWTWAEIIIFFVHHLLGVRPTPKDLLVRPRLLNGLKEVDAKLVIHGHDVHLKLRRAVKEPSASLDGKPVAVTHGSVTLPLPKKKASLEMNI
jgi:hypothetical protein